MFLRLILFLGVAASAVAQQPADAPARLDGLVLSSTDKVPLRKASVMAYPEGGDAMDQAERVKNTTTNDEGRFSLDLPAGRYRVMISRNGYLDQEYGAADGGGGVPLNLAAGQILSITVRLVPTSVVLGRVSDEEGEPISGAVVSVARYTYMRGRRMLMPLGQEQSNDLGEYRISNLHPGSRYYISASYSGAAPSSSGRTTMAYGTTYHPNTPDVTEATPVMLDAGQELRVDFQLVPRPAFTISGQVDVDSAEKNRSVMVMLADAFWTSGDRHQTVVSDGKFEMEGVPPGTHTLVAIAVPEDQKSLMSGNMRSGTAKVTIADSNVSDVVISISGGGGGEVKGRIVVNSSSKPDLTNLIVALERAQADSEPGFFAAAMARMSGGSAQVKPDGTFIFENVSPGEYNATIYATDPEWRDFYAAAIEFNGRDALSAPIKISGGGNLVLTASPDGGVITGTVTQADGKPAAGAAVVAVPSEQFRHRRDFYHDAIADQNGRYEIHGAAPGAYRVYAWDSAEAKEAVFDPDFLKRFAGRGTDLRVNAGGRHSLDLSVIDTGDEFDPLPGGFARGFTGFRGRRRFR